LLFIFVILERLRIMKHKTLFTYRSTIQIKDVQKSDALAYICIGESTSLDTIVDDTYELIVHGNYNYFLFSKINLLLQNVCINTCVLRLISL